MQTQSEAPSLGIQALLSRWRAFCLPGGEQSVRSIRAVRTTEAGRIRVSPAARGIPFTAVQTVDATRSYFRWEAHLDPGKFVSPTVIDAYEEGHGRLAVKVGGVIPVKKARGRMPTRESFSAISPRLCSVRRCC